MARHHLLEPRVQRVVERLAEQFIRLGSVNALADALTETQLSGAARIYPNRLHGLLGEDPTRSVNSATLTMIEQGLDELEIDGRGRGDGTVEQRVAAALAQVSPASEDPVAVIAEAIAVPRAVVRRLTALVGPRPGPTEKRGSGPIADWSWQQDAVSASIRALRKRADYKAGLVVPTGGGKTKIALQVGLEWLVADARDDSVILWVTHRRRLQLQARRALQWLLREPGAVPDGATTLFANRIRFVMISELADAIATHSEHISLIIVDEAHHAAAPSYEPIFTETVAPGLFLTATPNRADALPIGIDEIAYTITYRELFARGCLVEPIFEPPLDLRNLDWSRPEGLRDLADYLLDRAEHDFGKVLVAVSLRERAETLHDGVLDLLDERSAHPLSADDIGFVHADRSSAGIDPAEFLDEFTARPNGVLIATSQFVGEGYDDPSIDAVVVTYPSTSISHLMQVAGRALRSAPDKATAHVVQVRESPLEYHFDQRWLYQDISDQLRPDLVDLTYASSAELQERVRSLLETHWVPDRIRHRILDELAGIDPDQDLQLMLSGVPYFGDADDFASDAEWGAILVGPGERSRFVLVFNDVSYRADDIKEHGLYLRRHITPDSRAGSLWKSYVDLITAMEYARREITATPYAGESSRPFNRGRSTTWLRYVSFRFEPAIPPALESFLHDAVNQDGVIGQYLNEPGQWAAVVKLELPLTGTYAYLLHEGPADWLEQQRGAIVERLRDVEPLQGFEVLTGWSTTLAEAPLPIAIVSQIHQLTRPDRFGTQYLRLRTGDEPTAAEPHASRQLGTASGEPQTMQPVRNNRSRGHTYSVYVVELEPAACRDGAWKGCLYVGETGLRPEERFARHKAGGQTSVGVVRRYGIRLRSDLARGIGPFATRAEAQAAEGQLAETLRLQGYAVFGGQGRTFAPGHREEPSSSEATKVSRSQRGAS